MAHEDPADRVREFCEARSRASEGFYVRVLELSEDRTGVNGVAAKEEAVLFVKEADAVWRVSWGAENPEASPT